MKWISVDKEKPAYGKRYLVNVFYDCGYKNLNYSLQYCCLFCCLEGFMLPRDAAIERFKATITHWAELPEPPKDNE